MLQQQDLKNYLMMVAKIVTKFSNVSEGCIYFKY